MEFRLKSALKNYYFQLETRDRKLREILENLKNPIQALINLSKQHQHVTSREVDNAAICDFDDLRERLDFKIRKDIESEVSSIIGTIGPLRNYVEDLQRELHRLESVRSEASIYEPTFKELVDGTPYVPRLDLLMQWSIESCNEVSEYCGRLLTSFKDIDYLDPEEVEKWAKSINRPSSDHCNRTKEILGITQFLIEGLGYVR